MLRRLWPITILAGCLILYGIFYIFAAIALVHQRPYPQPHSVNALHLYLRNLFYFLYGILYITCGVAFLKKQYWSRYLFIFFFAFTFLNPFPIFNSSYDLFSYKITFVIVALILFNAASAEYFKNNSDAKNKIALKNFLLPINIIFLLLFSLMFTHFSQDVSGPQVVPDKNFTDLLPIVACQYWAYFILSVSFYFWRVKENSLMCLNASINIFLSLFVVFITVITAGLALLLGMRLLILVTSMLFIMFFIGYLKAIKSGDRYKTGKS